MSPTPQQLVPRLVAFATLGTFVVMTTVFATVLLRSLQSDVEPRVATTPRRTTNELRAESQSTERTYVSQADATEATANVRQATAIVPLTFTDVPNESAAGPSLGFAQQISDAPIASPYPIAKLQPVPRVPSSPNAQLTLPEFPSSASPVAAEPLPPIVETVPQANPPIPSADGPITAGPIPSPPPSLPTPLQADTAASEAPAHAPSPPSPWSRFVAVYGNGHFTEQGTITLADVRMLALRNNKDIAVLGNLPDIATATAGLEEAIFDPVFTLNPVGGRYNRQTATQVQSLNANSNVLKTGFLMPGSSLNQVYLEKLYSSGGRVQIGAGQNMTQFSPAGDFVLVNPAWQSSVNMIVEQPLFRGRGPNWNEAPVRIARANQAQSQHAFQATVNQVLRDAETAYWETYAAYQDFEVRRTAAAQALETVERERGRLRLGEGSVPDVAQAEEQAEAFQIAQALAENKLVDAQRTLRRLMGLPPDDPRPIIPATAASDAPIVVGWEEAASQALTRPEFGAQRAIVEAAEIEVCRRRNGLLPDISVRAIYSVTGLDNHWDEAWSTVGTAGYNDWTVGAVYKQPLGRRADNSFAQRAAATLSLESAKLRQLEHEILHQLDAACRNVAAAERLLSMHRRRREAAAVQLEARRELYLENRAQLRDELDAEVRYASAVLDESIARVNYQRALTDWNYARGAISGGDVVVAP